VLLAAVVAWGPSLAAVGTSRADGADTLSVAEREDHSPVLVASPSGEPHLLWIATAPDTNVAGRFDEIALARHDGTGWTAPVILAGPGNYYTPGLAFAADGSRWSCWADHDGNDSQIFARRDLADSTSLFELGDPAQPDLEPAICADDAGGVIVVWQAWRTDDYEIVMRRFDGAAFTPEALVSDCANNDREPDVVWGDGQAWIVWSSYQGEPYNLVLRTFDGSTLSAPTQLTTSYRARNLHPEIAWDGANGLLWVASILVNQGWNGFNNNEPGLWDAGSPRIRAFDGTTLWRPAGVDSAGRPPLLPMESLGYEDYGYGGIEMEDRWGTGVEVLAAPGGRLWCFHKQRGVITELGAPNRYWGVVGTRYDGSAWSAPDEFLELRTSIGWEAPAVCAIGETLWIAWSADDRSPYIFDVSNLFGHDLDVVARSVTVDTTGVGPPTLVSLGAPPAVGACVPSPRPPFTIQEGGTTRTLLFGDNHRHNSELSWDGFSDPALRQTIMYSLDWLGHDFIVPSDHAERYSKAIWAWVAKWAMIFDIPGRFRVFAGYERAMRGYHAAGGDQNTTYRDPADFREATAAYPAIGSWHTMYAAMSGIDVLAVPHTSAECGAIVDWDHLAAGDPLHLPAPLRVVEVYQSARESFEYPGCPKQFWGCVAPAESGWVSVALAKGLRLGIIAASDHTIRAGFISVFAEDRSRDAIWQALHDRRTYGSSRSAKFNVEFRVAGALMGSEVESSLPPQVYVHVEGANPLTKIEVNKDGDPTWFVANVSGTVATVVHADPAPVVPGTSSFYYARAYDTADKMLWTSPVWVDFVEPDPTSSAPVAAADGPLALRPRPNPSRGAMSFAISGMGRGGGRLRIHDVGGRLVRRLDLVPGASERNVAWDGRDERGVAVAPGVYYAVLQARGRTESSRVVRLSP
jgi:hypothetical protein